MITKQATTKAATKAATAAATNTPDSISVTSNKRHKPSIATTNEDDLPATPQTLASPDKADNTDKPTMDSDDDFNSLASGSEMDFDDEEASSVDFGAGMCCNTDVSCCCVS